MDLRYIKTMKVLRIGVIFILVLLPGTLFSQTTPKIGLLPFNDLNRKEVDLTIPSLIQTELAGYEGLEVLPMDVVMKEIERVRPELLWEEESSKGMWLIMERERIEKVKPALSADILLYGDRSRFGDVVRVNIYLSKKGKEGLYKTFSVEGREEELPEKLKEVSKEIASFIASEGALKRAQEYARGYRGGIYTYEVTLRAIKGLLEKWGSVRIEAIYLSLLLERGKEREGDILKEGKRLIELYDPLREEDTRFLLSLGLDPFDTVARIYESEGRLKEAIEIRKKALEVFPYNRKRHTKALGKDHYLLGLSLEEKSNREEAKRHYREALRLLPPSLEEYRKAKERLTP